MPQDGDRVRDKVSGKEALVLVTPLGVKKNKMIRIQFVGAGHAKTLPADAFDVIGHQPRTPYEHWSAQGKPRF